MNTEGNAIPAAGGASGPESAPRARDLTGQVAVVTGASRAIGRAIAIRLGRLGASVVVNYSRDSSGAAETVAAIKAAGSRAIDIRADVSKPAEIESLLDTARRRLRPLHHEQAGGGNYLVGVLAQEIGKRGITVNTVIAPATDGAGHFTERNDDDPLRAPSPLGSRMGTADDVADAVEFFTGKLARWISGTQVPVSGGAP